MKLIKQLRLQPALPDQPHGVGRRGAESLAARFRQREFFAMSFRQLGSLHEQRPGESLIGPMA